MVANKLLRGALAAALAVALSFSVSGCANDSLADQFKAGGNKNYIGTRIKNLIGCNGV